LVVHEIPKALDDVDLASICGRLAGRSGNSPLLVEVPKNQGLKMAAVDSHRRFEAHRMLKMSFNRSAKCPLVVDTTNVGLMDLAIVF
jgi:hypothetical protein